MRCDTEGVEAEKVGVDAANQLLRNVNDGGCVDEFLQDQVNSAYQGFMLLPPAGQSTSKIMSISPVSENLLMYFV